MREGAPVAGVSDTGAHVGRDAPRLPRDAPPACRDATPVAEGRIRMVTIPLAAGVGVLAGPWLRGLVFAHAVGWRQPLRQHCPACGTSVIPMTWRGLLAVAPLDGRCPTCRTPIGPVAGSVEILAALVLSMLAMRAPSGWVLAAWIWWALLGIALALIDTAVHRLPDPLTTAATGGVGLVLTAEAITSGEVDPLIRALACAAGLALVYLVAILAPGGMGRGDGALAVSIGLLLGRISVPAVVLATVLTAGLAGAWTALGRIRGRLGGSDAVALGPHMIIGALVALLVNA
ncbi:MAG: prepilin peptidase [Dactylosporangium sp.]|nr:A24 family peptidase [Dactylosporangium sp.]NNJ62330.1 prepilin peptidase [Dactylosporangium sp.]